MKILVVCQYYYPENFQITPICEQLAADGYDITVLTGLPNYPTGVIPDEYKTGHRDEVVNGVRVIRCTEIVRKHSMFSLAINFVSFVKSASKMIDKLDPDYDLVFVYQLSPVLMAIPGRKYARRYNVPMAIYCCDLWPESLKVHIKNERNPIFMLIKRISYSLYNSADKIICQSQSFVGYMRQIHRIPRERLSYIPAFADGNYLTMDFTPENDTVDLVFLGNLGIAQNLIAVLEAIDKIKDVPGFKVHFVGEGSMLSEMIKFVDDHGLQDIVVFHGRRSVKEMPEFYKLADACLISLKADTRIGLTLPTKMQGYMAAGKPVLGMISGSAREVIEESGCGLVVNADDTDGFAGIIREFVLHREKYSGCGPKARSYFVKNFTKEICMKKLEEEFERMVK